MIDANGTRFHLVLGGADWSRAVFSGAEYDPVLDAARLGTVPHRLALQPGDHVPTRATRRSPSADRFGSIYWISGDRRSVLVQSSGTDAVSVLWPETYPPPTARQPAGAFTPSDMTFEPPPLLDALAVTEDHLLVVASKALGGLLVFDLRWAGAPTLARWPTDMAFAPSDMAARAGGGVFIIESAERRFWELDRWLRVVSPAPDPLDPGLSAASFVPSDATIAAETSAISFERLGESFSPVAVVPVAVESLGNGAVVLGEGGEIVRFDRDVNGRLRSSSLSSVEPGVQDIAVRAGDDALLLVHRDGNQVIAVDPTTGVELADQYPLRNYSGEGLVVLRDASWYCSNGLFVSLVRLRQRRYASEGTIHLGPFDGREAGCVWHRLFIEGGLNPGATVEVDAIASDDPSDLKHLSNLDWRAQPQLTRSRSAGHPEQVDEGSGRPFHGLLFQHVEGRHLALRLRLVGDGRVTPTIASIRVWYPRFSYASYLPAEWRADPHAASLLERLLALFELEFTAIEDRLTLMRLMIDARTADPDSLNWMVSWMGLAFDPAWPTATRRRFLRHVDRMLETRGTRQGVRLALRLALFPDLDELALFSASRHGDPRIIEEYSTLPMPGRGLIAGGDRTVDEDLFSRLRHWVPELGAAALLDSWRAIGGSEPFPVRPPEAATASRWREFCRAVIGFVPDARQADEPAWTEFLRARYGDDVRLAASYGKAGADLDAQRLPVMLPSGTSELRDWYEFERVIVSRRRAAHRFRVLLPLPQEFIVGEITQSVLDRRVDLVSRVVEAAKPAHTAFTVDWFWSAFSVGLARLGYDTLLDGRTRSIPPGVEGIASEALSLVGGRALAMLRTGTEPAGLIDIDPPGPTNGQFFERRSQLIAGPQRSRL